MAEAYYYQETYKKGPESSIFSACLHWEAQLNKQRPAFTGPGAPPMAQLRLKLFERDQRLLLRSGFMALLGWKQKCSHFTAVYKAATSERDDKTIRRLTRVPTVCSFMNCQDSLIKHIYWATESSALCVCVRVCVNSCYVRFL